jgi:AbrB family looped-hinge helix DNA binding protein
MRMTVTDKWQVTIPKPLRKQLGLRPGQVLDVKAERGHLVATKADSVERVYGILRLGHSTNRILTALRGKADAV